MTSNRKFKLLSLSTGVCFALVVALGVTTWNFHNRLNSIEQRENTSLGDVHSSLTKSPRDLDDWDEMQKWLGQAPHNLSEVSKWMDEQMDKMMANDTSLFSGALSATKNNPAIRLEDDKDEYKVVVKVPEGENIEVNAGISNGILTISGEVTNENENSQKNGFSRSQSISSFSQSLVLDQPVDQAKLKVIQKDEEVIVTVPKIVS